MAKTVPPTSNYALQKCDKGDNYMEDRISELPDGILVSIVSLLTIREATRTSVLSHRWEKLWTFITDSLHFDASKIKWEIKEEKKSLKVERFRYVGWVNQVLDSHQGSTLDEFRVCFDLNKRSRRYIDKWIEIAMAKRVQRLELDLSPFWDGFPLASMHYTFPQNCYNLLKSPYGLSCIKYLTSLCLKFVNVTGELLEYFLSNCPLLERLCVVGSEHLVNLKVADSSLQLKSLEILNCLCLESVDICAPSLLSFKYQGQRIALHVKNVPLLRDVSILGKYGVHINYVFSPLSSYLSQLVTLMLDMCLFEENIVFPQFPEFTNLRHLTWRVHASDERSLLGLTSMIEASPFLHRFTFELTWYERKQREVQKAVKCPHQYLKVVEIVGFVGSTIDVELATYLLECAVMLEKIIVDPRSPYTLGTPWRFEEHEEYTERREHAQQLVTKLPPGAKLVVL